MNQEPDVEINWDQRFSSIGYDLEFRPRTDRLGSCWRLIATNVWTGKRYQTDQRSTDECLKVLYERLKPEEDE